MVSRPHRSAPGLASHLSFATPSVRSSTDFYSYIEWVPEDRFPSGRPPSERAGVRFAHDVPPFETLKIRVSNGGRAVIAYPAGLLGIEFVHEAMAHPLVAGVLDRVEREEVAPHVALGRGDISFVS